MDSTVAPFATLAIIIHLFITLVQVLRFFLQFLSPFLHFNVYFITFFLAWLRVQIEASLFHHLRGLIFKLFKGLDLSSSVLLLISEVHIDGLLIENKSVVPLCNQGIL